MRRGLWLGLLASVASAAWVLFTPEPVAAPSTVVAASAPRHPTSPARLALGLLAARWDAPALEPARRNPFGAEAPISAARAASVPAPVPKLVVAQAPAVPVAAAIVAPFGYRYVGRVIDPQGQRIVYVGRGDQVVTVQAGTQLADGYVVESMSESAIEVVHAPTMQRQTIAIPPDATATAVNSSAN